MEEEEEQEGEEEKENLDFLPNFVCAVFKLEMEEIQALDYSICNEIRRVKRKREGKKGERREKRAELYLVDFVVHETARVTFFHTHKVKVLMERVGEREERERDRQLVECVDDRG